MKKIRIITIFVLCFIFLTSTVSAIFSGLLTVKADTHNYDIDYKTLSYSEFDSATRRTGKPNKSPQITVFTYGCGGNLGHWSHDDD